MIGVLNSDSYEQSSWEVRMSNSKGLPYFFNSETKQSMWSSPKDLTKEQIMALPGAEYLNTSQIKASHLLVKHKDSRRPSSWKEVSVSVCLHFIRRSEAKGASTAQYYTHQGRGYCHPRAVREPDPQR